MRFLIAIVIASCFSLASAALTSPQQAPPPQDAPPAAATPLMQQKPDKESAPQGDKPTPKDSKPEAKPETNTETKTAPQKTTRTEPANSAKNQAASESTNPPQPAPKNRPDSEQSKARTKAHANRKPAAQPAPPPSSGPRKIVVREGGAAEPETQIVSNLTPQEASRERQNTEDLLNSTREILQGLSGRFLDAQQQETVSQISRYMEGSRSALKEGDIARANTLALKANLLADDLAKH